MSVRRQIWLALALIIPVAAVASYLQALKVVQAVDGHGPVSFFVAALADPTIFAASANIYDAHRSKTRLPGWSLLSVAVALVVSGGANILAGHHAEAPTWLVRLWPLVAFVMALESLMSFVRRHRAADPDAVADTCPHRAASTADDAIRVAYEHARDCLGRASYREVGRQFGVHHSKVAELVTVSTNGQAPHE